MLFRNENPILGPQSQIASATGSVFSLLPSGLALANPPGNVYVVGNANDTNLSYIVSKFGGTRYADNSLMFQSSIQAAINACIDLRGDVVLIGPRTYTPTTPILFNKKGITVAALFDFGGAQDNGERTTIDSQATADIAAVIVSEPCTISGLGFSSANTVATGTGGAIVLGPGSGFDGGNFVHITNCRFTNWGDGAYGIASNYNDYLKIDHCDFDGTVNGVGGSANNVFDAGIELIQGHYVTVEENTFRGCTYAIQHGTPNPASADHSNQNFIYKGNRVIVANGTEKFIDFNTLATYSKSYGLVADNWLGTATDTASYNDTVANAKTGKVTFSNNHYAE